jgi:diguanylate cyclase (GGDEF)-like protein
MNFVDRQDRFLLAGLVIAVVVVFSGPIRYLLDLAREVERSSGLALIPALLILIFVFFIHQQGKRQEAKAHALAAEADAETAQTRAAELERLVHFGEALGRSLDLESIRDAAAQHLPKLAESDEPWVMLRAGGHWQALMSTARDGRHEVERAREQIANRALQADGGVRMTPVSADGQLCFPLTAGGQTLGVLGIPERAGPFTAGRQRVFAAAATLLAIAVRNAQLFEELRENSLRDGLTGCVNRTHAIEVIATELRRARRSQTPVSVIMFDIDHFKEINDRFGHLCGDAVLAAVGARMRAVLRGGDVKCRYGGDEFLVLLPETPLEGAKRVAETLRREFADMPIGWKDERLTITTSFGVTSSLPSEMETDAIIGRADAALYRAKDVGRNCVRVADEPVLATR